MNKVQEIFENTPNAAEFSKNYLKYLTEIFDKIDYAKIDEFVGWILGARDKGKTVFFVGNGGSAATASHFANDIAVGTRTSGKPFRVMSLTDNNAVMTAIGNDFGYDKLFTKQLEAYMQDGDIVVAISASGNSPNIIDAIDFAKKNGNKTVGISGFDGGKLAEMSDLSLHVPAQKGEYGPVEDLHMIFDHIIGNYLLNYCKKND